MAKGPGFQCRWYIPLSKVRTSAAKSNLEFCYNIKYIARNDRPQRNPWSIRQIGVYERLDLHTGQSVWIILQPSERAYRRFRETTELPQTSIEGTGSASMTLHTAILIAAGREWGEYLEDLRKQMQRLVRVPQEEHRIQTLADRTARIKKQSFLLWESPTRSTFQSRSMNVKKYNNAGVSSLQHCTH